MIRLEMKNYNTILTEKLLKYLICHQINLLSMNIFTGEEILQSNQKQMIQQAKFIYSPIDKAFKKQIKTIQDQREKQNQGQVKTIKIYDYDDEDSPLISKVKKNI